MQVKLLNSAGFISDFSAVSFPVTVPVLTHSPETGAHFEYVTVSPETLTSIGVVGTIADAGPLHVNEKGWRFLVGPDCTIVEE
jgi:hypothetical protein